MEKTPGSLEESKIVFVQRLANDWTELADLLGIKPNEQQRFPKGEEAREIWNWLERRKQLRLLPGNLIKIDRSDLAEDLSILQTEVEAEEPVLTPPPPSRARKILDRYDQTATVSEDKWVSWTISKTTLIQTIGAILFFSKLVVIGLLIYLSLSSVGGLEFNEATTIIFMIAPLFMINLTQIVEFITEHSKQTGRKRKNEKYSAFLSLFGILLAGIYGVALFALVYARAYNEINFEQLKTIIGIIEVCVGFYLGMILKGVLK